MLSTLGLTLAASTSLVNVFADVTRKKAFSKGTLTSTTFWIRLVIASVIGLVVLFRVFHGYTLGIHPDRDAAGLLAQGLSPNLQFLEFLVADLALIGVSTTLYYRAIQVSALSLTIPFLAFTPVFLLVSSGLLLGELPEFRAGMGVVCVVGGSLVMHRAALMSGGVIASARAIFREKGSVYMLLVSLILAISNPLDKKLVGLSDPYTQALAYSCGLVVIFSIPVMVRRAGTLGTLLRSWKWIALTGLFDGTDLLLQFASHKYIPVVVTISLKRAGIVFAVLAGWLIFRERDLEDRLLGSFVMVAGALLIYLPVSDYMAISVTIVTFGFAAIVLWLTKHKEAGYPK